MDEKVMNQFAENYVEAMNNGDTSNLDQEVIKATFDAVKTGGHFISGWTTDALKFIKNQWNAFKGLFTNSNTADTVDTLYNNCIAAAKSLAADVNEAGQQGICGNLKLVAGTILGKIAQAVKEPSGSNGPNWPLIGGCIAGGLVVTGTIIGTTAHVVKKRRERTNYNGLQNNQKGRKTGFQRTKKTFKLFGNRQKKHAIDRTTHLI